MAKSQVKGVLEVFHRSPVEHDLEWLDFLEALASQTAIAIENASLFNDLQRANLELNLAYNSTLEGWSRALDLRDRETEGHSQRVTELTLQLARAMSVDEAELVHMRRGALLHDIGKLGIPDKILLKPGPLSEEESEIIRKHPTIAFEMLAPIAYLRPALDIPYCHHEKWDGSGYPRGLKGEQISLAARIFAVVDVWDALLSDRPYRKGWPEEEARAYLVEQAGGHFDPQVVDAFLSLLSDEENAKRKV
jgi:putative nucleotidyltransferase with HDIG domain